MALVTGASCGIGFSLAKRLAMGGMKVVGCARNIQKIQVPEPIRILVDDQFQSSNYSPL